MASRTELKSAVASALRDQRLSDAIPHVKELLAATPEAGWLWALLARCSIDAGEVDFAACLRAAEFPLDLKSSIGVANALVFVPGELAIGALRGLHAQHPGVATQLAVALWKHGCLDESGRIWRELLEEKPSNLTAREYLGRIHQPGTHPRIAIVGNCQAYGVADCLRRMYPSAWLAAYSWLDFATTHQRSALMKELSTYDIVLSHEENKYWKADPATFPAKRLVKFPRLAFTGFQPDLLPFGKVHFPRPHSFSGWHSQIILGGWRLGISTERVEDLFNSYVYGALGYFDEFGLAMAFQSEEFETSGVRVTLPSGPFMHVPNHPNMAAIWAVSEGVCAALGVRPEPSEPPSDQQARRTVWPLYPEIGKRLGQDGSLVFQTETGQSWGLRQVIDDAFDLYSQTSGTAFTNLVEEPTRKLKSILA